MRRPTQASARTVEVEVEALMSEANTGERLSACAKRREDGKSPEGDMDAA